MKYSLVSPIFFKRSLIFSILLLPSISFHYSFKKAFLSLLTILWISAFSWVYLSLCPLPFASLLVSIICKAYSDNNFSLFAFVFLGMVLFTTSFLYNITTSVHSCSGTLFIGSNLLILSPPLYNHKGFDLSHKESYDQPR